MSSAPDPELVPEDPAAAYGFDAAYRGAPPNWDIGRPQRAFVFLEEAGRIGRRVLEVGCGTGELSLFLARRGHDVLGVDFARSAIEQAPGEGALATGERPLPRLGRAEPA